MFARYVVYTIRDSAGGVRYVGCTYGDLMKRLAAHQQAKTLLGRFLREEKSARRVVTVVPEAVFRSDDYAHARADAREWSARCDALACEREYIRGYGNLLGDMLFNVSMHPKRKATLAKVLDLNCVGT